MQQQIVPFNPTGQMTYAFGSMNLVEKSTTGSDSGSSVGSNGDSPPDTPSFMNSTATVANPAQMRAKQQLSLSNRLNKIQQGGTALYATPTTQPNTTTSNNNLNNNNQDFSGQVTSSNSNSSLNSSNNNNLVQYQQRPPQTTTVIPMMPFRPANASTVPTTAAAFQMQPNGELIFQPFQPVQPVQAVYLPPPSVTPQTTPGSTHSHRSSPSAQPQPAPTPPMLLNTPAFPTSKMILSCFNCGSTTHTGRECHEASMEDVTRNATYKLDYSSNNSLHSQNTAPPMMTKQSVSSASLSSMGGDQQGNKELLANSASAPQFEPIGSSSPIIIDLTQDTSSSSSSVSSIHK
jgi:hypothetical protein